MSGDGSMPTKRTRFMLGSNTRFGHIDAVQTEPTEPKRKQKRKDQLQLMDLNDDCLLKIFGYLNVKKLCIIAETCTRAQALAQYTFRLKCHGLDLFIWPNILSLELVLKSKKRFAENVKISWNETEKFFCIFGNCIQSLIISQHGCEPEDQLVKSESQKILTLIGKYCGINLIEIELSKIYIKTEWMENAKQVFGSLKTLVLKDCIFKVRYISRCPSTENLEVLDVQFHKYQKTPLIEYKAVIKFLNTAKALKRFSIRISPQLPRSIANAISQSIHLEELVIDSEITTHHVLNWVSERCVNLMKSTLKFYSYKVKTFKWNSTI